MERLASARWAGGLKGGKGTVSASSGAFENLAYSFSTRFEDAPGTNPEELVAAAHAGCFSMALAAGLEGAGFAPESVETTATLHFEKGEGGWSTSSIHLDTRAKATGLDAAALGKAAEAAKASCPISRLLKTEITVSAQVI